MLKCIRKYFEIPDVMRDCDRRKFYVWAAFLILILGSLGCDSREKHFSQPLSHTHLHILSHQCTHIWSPSKRKEESGLEMWNAIKMGGNTHKTVKDMSQIDCILSSHLKEKWKIQNIFELIPPGWINLSRILSKCGSAQNQHPVRANFRYWKFPVKNIWCPNFENIPILIPVIITWIIN